MLYSPHKSRLCLAAEFVCAARGYWLSVFPRVRRELRRKRVLAARIPDPALRRLALQALEQKGGNLEGAAAFATLVSGRQRRSLVVRALVDSQAMCDYLDLLCEQPNRDPVLNGRALHGALLNALSDGSGGDYYRHNTHGDDGGYLQGLVEGVNGSLAGLPGRFGVAEPVMRAAERIVAYQSLNHGDSAGSYQPFERWAAREGRACPGLSWWEAGAGAGSTLTLHVLVAAAADVGIDQSEATAIEQAYFPWVGALHSLLDSLVDRGEDVEHGMQGLIDFYVSPAEAANCMRTIAAEAVQQAQLLRQGGLHTLIIAAMVSFYLCQLQSRDSSPLPVAVVPVVREALGDLAAPSMVVLRARRLLHRDGDQPALPAPDRVGALESRKSST